MPSLEKVLMIILKRNLFLLQDTIPDEALAIRCHIFFNDLT